MRTRRVIVALAVLATAMTLVPASSATAATQVGLKAHSYAGFNAESAGGAITGQKPESKLWFLDGKWWAAMLNPTAAGAHQIYRLDGTTWVSTGTVIDSRPATKEDVLWTGSKLYVVSRWNGTSGTSQLRRFTYAGGTYSLDAGYPVTVPGTGAETTTIARDSTGTLWVTFEENTNIYVARAAESAPATWTKYIIPESGATGVDSDDISAVTAFTDSTGSAIGVMWSNQITMTDYFAVHRDGAGDTASDWSQETALTGDHEADDHINLKTFEGKVYAVTKTSKNDIGATGQPIIRLLVRSTAGAWSKFAVVNVGERVTSRPITILDIDPVTRQVYVFMTIGEGSTANGIAYKKTSLDNPSFPSSWTVFIQGPNAEKISDATSTKQNANGGGTSGVVVLASDTLSYWWNNVAAPPTPDYTLSASPTSQTVTAGGTTGNYAITVTRTNGHSAPVTLSASGLPAGAGATFTPTTVTTPNTSNMTISTDGSTTPPGTYPITVQGTDTSTPPLVRTTSVTLVVNAPPTPNYTLSALPTSQAVTQGGTTGNYVITVSRTNGHSADVGLLASGLPAGATAVFSPATVTTSGNTSNLTISTTASTLPGSYPITVQGTDTSTPALVRTTQVTLTVNAAPTAPGAPTLSASAGDGVVHLSWTAPSNGGAAITNYKVYRGTTSNGETLLTTLGNVTSNDDTSAANGTTYYYKVTAVNSVGESAPSNEVTAAPKAITAPEAPVLTASQAKGKGIQLSWTVPVDGGSPITGYKIYRGTAAGGETLLATVGNVTSYKDSKATRGTTYYYYVTAVNAVGESAPSNEGSAQSK